MAPIKNTLDKMILFLFLFLFSFCYLLIVSESFQFCRSLSFRCFNVGARFSYSGRQRHIYPQHIYPLELSASFRSTAEDEIIGNFVVPSSYPSNELSPLRCSLFGIYSTTKSQIGIGVPVEEPVYIFSLDRNKLKFLSPVPIGSAIDNGTNDRYEEVVGYISKQLEQYGASLTATPLFPTLTGVDHFEEAGKDGEADVEEEENEDESDATYEVNEIDANVEDESFEDVLEREIQSLNSEERLTRKISEGGFISSPLSDAVVTEEDEKWLEKEAALVDRIVSSYAVDVKYFASFHYKKKNYHILRMIEVKYLSFFLLFFLPS
jgi:hypothetical protein